MAYAPHQEANYVVIQQPPPPQLNRAFSAPEGVTQEPVTLRQRNLSAPETYGPNSPMLLSPSKTPPTPLAEYESHDQNTILLTGINNNNVRNMPDMDEFLQS